MKKLIGILSVVMVLAAGAQTTKAWANAAQMAGESMSFLVEAPQLAQATASAIGSANMAKLAGFTAPAAGVAWSAAVAKQFVTALQQSAKTDPQLASVAHFLAMKDIKTKTGISALSTNNAESIAAFTAQVQSVVASKIDGTSNAVPASKFVGPYSADRYSMDIKNTIEARRTELGQQGYDDLMAAYDASMAELAEFGEPLLGPAAKQCVLEVDPAAASTLKQIQLAARGIHSKIASAASRAKQAALKVFNELTGNGPEQMNQLVDSCEWENKALRTAL